MQNYEVIRHGRFKVELSDDGDIRISLKDSDDTLVWIDEYDYHENKLDAEPRVRLYCAESEEVALTATIYDAGIVVDQYETACVSERRLDGSMPTDVMDYPLVLAQLDAHGLDLTTHQRILRTELIKALGGKHANKTKEEPV